MRTVPAILVTSLILSACGGDAPEPEVQAEPEPVAQPAPAETNVEEVAAPVPRNPLKDAYFGNLHVHTAWSFDAFINGAIAGPDEAYRWAKGEAIARHGERTMNMKAGWSIGACAVLLAACSDQEGSMAESQQQPDNSLMRVISGEVWYRERIALPPGAEVIVTLEDQSRADAPATVITDYTHIVDDEQVPYSFRLVYDPAAIDERMTYGLRARILEDGELMFTSTEHIDPFAGEPGELVRIMVSRQGGN